MDALRIDGLTWHLDRRRRRLVGAGAPSLPGRTDAVLSRPGRPWRTGIGECQADSIGRGNVGTGPTERYDHLPHCGQRNLGGCLHLFNPFPPAQTEPLAERHEGEVDALNERIARYGERGSGKKALEDRHRREQRRHRVDELMAGLTVIAAVYRDALVAGRVPRPDDVADAVARIHHSIEALERNPNEALLLQHLLWSLPVLG
jgi:hypothetical protein